MKTELTEGQQKFYDAVMEGKSVFLQGKAGTGKTFISKLVIEALKKNKKNIIAIAPTGVAANNLGGSTMHSVFSLPVHGVLEYDTCNYVVSNKRRIFEKVDVIFIDEVSMVRADVLDGIEYTLRKNIGTGLENKQVIFVGDMGQLPPIASDNFLSVMTNQFDYQGVNFYYAHIIKKLKITTIQLEEVKRQSDPEFISALNKIRDGIKDPYFKTFHGKPVKGIILAPHRETVTRYNLEGLNKQEGKVYKFKASVSGKIKLDDYNLDDIVTVKPGCTIMYLVNSKNNSLVNGTIGTFEVEQIEKNKHNAASEMFFIKVKSVRYPLEIVELVKKDYVYDEDLDEIVMKTIGTIKQMPIRLAYALSIHKSQGLTFDEVTVDLSRPTFAPGQLYVALSKVTTPQGLSIVTGDRKIK